MRIIDHSTIQTLHLRRDGVSVLGSIGIAALMDGDGDVVWVDTIHLNTIPMQWRTTKVRALVQDVRNDLVKAGGIRAQWKGDSPICFIVITLMESVLEVLSRYNRTFDLPSGRARGLAAVASRLRILQVHQLLCLRSMIPSEAVTDPVLLDAVIQSGSFDVHMLRRAFDGEFSQVSIDSDIARLLPYTRARYDPLYAATLR